jgi:hypothetical protein
VTHASLILQPKNGVPMGMMRKKQGENEFSEFHENEFSEFQLINKISLLFITT